jgi:hypothetical protein
MAMGKIDIASIEATLGFTHWVYGEDDLDVTFLMDKSINEGLDVAEQTRLDALIALYESGR